MGSLGLTTGELGALVVWKTTLVLGVKKRNFLIYYLFRDVNSSCLYKNEEVRGPNMAEICRSVGCIRGFNVSFYCKDLVKWPVADEFGLKIFTIQMHFKFSRWFVTVQYSQEPHLCWPFSMLPLVPFCSAPVNPIHYSSEFLQAIHALHCTSPLEWSPTWM